MLSEPLFDKGGPLATLGELQQSLLFSGTTSAVGASSSSASASSSTTATSGAPPASYDRVSRRRSRPFAIAGEKEPRGGALGANERKRSVFASDHGGHQRGGTIWCRETVLDFVYGLINFLRILPCVAAFAHIVCADDVFKPFFPYILKIVIFSSVVHQAVFCVYSGLLFAIGSVQDVGLIFLATITKSVVAKAEAENAFSSTEDREEVVATCLWACGVATLFCGAAVRAIGRRKLVDLVSLIPFPVVGGYLGYIGWFCFAAGLTIVSGEQIGTPVCSGGIQISAAVITRNPHTTSP